MLKRVTIILLSLFALGCDKKNVQTFPVFVEYSHAGIWAIPDAKFRRSVTISDANESIMSSGYVYYNDADNPQLWKAF